MSQPKPTVFALPARANDRAYASAADEGRPLFGSDGQIEAFRFPDGHIISAAPPPDPNNLPPAVINDSAYFDMGVRSLQAMSIQIQQVLALGEIANSAVAQAYAGSFLGGARSAIERFKQGRLTRQQLREALEQGRIALAGVQQAHTAAQAVAAMSQAEGERRALTDRFAEADYNQEWSRHVTESQHVLNLQLQPVDVANAHELALQRNDHANQVQIATINANLQIELGKQNVDVTTAQLTIASQDRDKDREIELIQTVQAHHGNSITNAMAELRLIEQQQPTEQITMVMGVLARALESVNTFGPDLTPEERKRLAPMILREVELALQQARRAVVRHG